MLRRSPLIRWIAGAGVLTLAACADEDLLTAPGTPAFAPAHSVALQPGCMANVSAQRFECLFDQPGSAGWVVPAEVMDAEFVVAGASGGSTSASRGLGGMMQATRVVGAGQHYRIVVGGQGGPGGLPGFNGGGRGGFNSATNQWGGGGGGASEIGFCAGASCQPLLIAGGGGGAGYDGGAGGVGGGESGGSGGGMSAGGGGGTESSGGAGGTGRFVGQDGEPGRGGPGASFDAFFSCPVFPPTPCKPGGGGGGGWFGGGSGAGDNFSGGGGGGSGYLNADELTGAQVLSTLNAGDGYLRITFWDGTPPVITSGITGKLGQNDWYVGDVTITWSVVEQLSQVTSSGGCGTRVVLQDTPGVAIRCEATSWGGTDAVFLTIKRDATAPTLSPTISPKLVLQYLPATATPNAVDMTSGIDQQSCATPATNVVGTQTVGCSASDNAGNKSAADVSYTVLSAAAATQTLIDQIVKANLEKSTEKSLTSLLQGVIGDLGKGKKAGALDKLTSFIAQVNAQNGKKIDPAFADAFIALANLIMSSVQAMP